MNNCGIFHTCELLEAEALLSSKGHHGTICELKFISRSLHADVCTTSHTLTRVHAFILQMWEGLRSMGLQPYVEKDADHLITVNTIKVGVWGGRGGGKGAGVTW